MIAGANSYRDRHRPTPAALPAFSAQSPQFAGVAGLPANDPSPPKSAPTEPTVVCRTKRGGGTPRSHSAATFRWTADPVVWRCSGLYRAPGGIRTHTVSILSRLSLPVGVRGRLTPVASRLCLPRRILRPQVRPVPSPNETRALHWVGGASHRPVRLSGPSGAPWSTRTL